MGDCICKTGFEWNSTVEACIETEAAKSQYTPIIIAVSIVGVFSVVPVGVMVASKVLTVAAPQVITSVAPQLGGTLGQLGNIGGNIGGNIPVVAGGSWSHQAQQAAQVMVPNLNYNDVIFKDTLKLVSSI